MPDDQQQSHRRRDAEALTIIGAFFAVLAVMVLIGVVWFDRGDSLAVGAGAGLLLLVIGLGGVYVGRRLKRSLD